MSSVNEIAVEGGVFNINSWSGGVETNALSVTGGVLNFGDTIYDVTTAGEFFKCFLTILRKFQR